MYSAAIPREHISVSSIGDGDLNDQLNTGI